MYAELAINAPVTGTFHYAVPPELLTVLQPGHLVQVTFRTALQYGIVLALAAESPLAQTKPITALLDPLPIISTAQIALGRWMSERTLSPIGSCLWLMLPPGITGGRDIRVHLMQEGATSPDPVESKILALLGRRGALTGRQLEIAKPLQGIQWRGAVDRLAKAAVVRKEPVLTPPRVRPQTVQTAALAIHPNQLAAVARHLGKESAQADILEVMAAMRVEYPTIEQVLTTAGVSSRDPLNKLEQAGLVTVNRTAKPHTVSLNIPRFKVDEQLIRLRGGEKDLHILRVLARESGPMDVSWLYAQTSAKLADLKRLADDELILLGEKTTWRDSLADRDFVPVAAPPLTPEQAAAWKTVEAAIKAWDWKQVDNTHPSEPFPVQGERGNEAFESDERNWRIPTHLWDKLKQLARQKRREPTYAEDLLWQQLRRNQLGYPVRRQHPIGRFIVDFYYAQARLIIEVDGDIHQYTKEEDAARQSILENLNYRFVRFTNDQVIHELPQVIESIRQALAQSTPTAFAPPLHERGGGWGEGLFLLHGVTGSGKTEIYLRAIEQTLAQGRQAIFLVPEIALTAQTVRRVAARFPGQVALVHSGLSDGERYDTWRRAREGLIGVVVGARSALFTPLPDVGLVILDEEHDSSYKQSEPIPHYHAREVAEQMMRLNNGVLILGSATPDVESVYRAEMGELTRLNLPTRIMGHRIRILEQAERTGVAARYFPARAEDALAIDLPPVEVVDMREELKGGNTSIFSRPMQQALAGVLERHEQAILFINRRGAATYVFCRDCGYVASCPRCDTPLTHHHQSEMLQCHRCGFQTPEPKKCPNCGSLRIKFFGAGTQQVERAFGDLFPKARTLRWDADTVTKPEMHDLFLLRFVERKADVLIGTQMIAKGLDLPLVTLVGVVSADMALNLPDFRAGERTFQLLTQVAGRAGRGLLGGRVVLQTYQPDHYAVMAAARHDADGFYAQEIAYRRDLGYPPFRRLARIVLRSESEARAQAEAEEAAAFLRGRLAKLKMAATELIGPAPCFFSRVNDIYRWHVLLRGPDPSLALRGLDIPRNWQLDLDPVDVL